jgi:hypothetical protein
MHDRIQFALGLIDDSTTAAMREKREYERRTDPNRADYAAGVREIVVHVLAPYAKNAELKELVKRVGKPLELLNTYREGSNFYDVFGVDGSEPLGVAESGELMWKRYEDGQLGEDFPIPIALSKTGEAFVETSPEILERRLNLKELEASLKNAAEAKVQAYLSAACDEARAIKKPKSNS